jgi:hypothetical protein
VKWVIQLLAALIPNIIKELLKIKPSMAEGKSDGSTEKRLKNKIKEAGWFK